MSREIKFRAWDSLRNEYLSAGRVMIQVLAGKLPKTPDGLHLDTSNFMCADGRMTLEQFTGTLDEDGIEIYEGDIVESDYYWPDFKESSVIGYDEFEMRFCFNNKLGDLNGEQDAFKYGNLKVVGNIHQNPELIK